MRLTMFAACMAAGMAFGALPEVAKISLPGEWKGHLQDVWYDGGEHLYWAETEDLLKTDLTGRILVRRHVEGHHAGLQVKDGRLFVAVCPMQGKTGGETLPTTRVIVGEYDAATLEPVEMHVTEVNDRAGSLCILEDGTFLVGCLRPPDILPSQVRFHHFDKNFKLIESHVLNDVSVALGIEVMKFHDGFVWACPYGLRIKLDRNFREVARYAAKGDCGLVFDGDQVWCGATSRKAKGAPYTSALVRAPALGEPIPPEKYLSRAQRVDPFIGTDTVGHTYPAAARPFGFVQAGPDTGFGDWKYCSGYQWSDDSLLGFSQTHLNGTGCPDLCDMQVLPFAGEARAMPMRAKMDKSSERASPGYYAVNLPEDGVNVEVTAAKRMALYRFRFTKPGAKVLFNLPFGQGNNPPAKWAVVKTADATFAATGRRRISGAYTRSAWIRNRRFAFAAEFDRDFSEVRELPAEGTVPRRLVVFNDVKPGETVMMKIAVSTVDESAAAANLAAELPGWKFQAARRAAFMEWDKLLGCMTCEGTEAERRTFYTSLYHLFLQPNDWADVDGRYRGADGKVAKSRSGRYFTQLSLWDTFRAAQPLLTIIKSDVVPAVIESFMLHYRAYGRLPVMSYGGKNVDCMIGNHSVPVLVDWFLKSGGAPVSGFTWEEIYAAVKNTLVEAHPGKPKENWDLYDKYGYFPCDIIHGESASRTLECAYNDACAAKLAEALGHAEDVAFFKRRAGYWRNVFDFGLKLARGKDSKGAWRDPYDPGLLGHGAESDNDFTEGNAYQYSWHVMHDPEGLAAACGGRDSLLAAIDAIFAMKEETRPGKNSRIMDVTGLIGQYAHGNEPGHHVPYFFSLLGRPERTAEIVGEVCDKFYYPRPDGLCGNDDCGQMSAWYLFSAAGFYPFDPCGGDYVLGAPQLPKVTFRLSGDGNRAFSVTARNLSRKNKYVKSVTLNGRPLEGPILRHADILAGGELVFEMRP